MVIISGGPKSVYSPGSPQTPLALFESGVPILGICYGHHLLAYSLGGSVESGKKGEYGEARLEIVGQDTILKGSSDVGSTASERRSSPSSTPRRGSSW